MKHIYSEVLFNADPSGYPYYRIPGIVVTKEGSILCYCEERTGKGGDWSPSNIVMRRHGKVGSPMQRISHPHSDALTLPNEMAVAQGLKKQDGATIHNPVMIVDDSTIHFLYCVEYKQCFYSRSFDDGITWESPIEITSVFQSANYPWRVIATGPGHGIRTSSGVLIVPVWLSTGEGKWAHRPSVMATINSIDSGKTWNFGDFIVPEGNADFNNPSEAAIVEDTILGNVQILFRHEGSVKKRGWSFSADGLGGWSKPEHENVLSESVCAAGMVSSIECQYYCGVDNPHGIERERLTIWRKKVGRSWKRMVVVEPGMAGYSDIAVHGDGYVYCFYERGTWSGSQYQPRCLKVDCFEEKV